MKQYYTVKEVAETLQVHWQTVLNYIKRGELQAVRLRKGYRISHTALLDFEKRNNTKGKK